MPGFGLGDLVTARIDVNDIVGGISEMEEDGVGMAAGASPTEAREDLAGGKFGVLGVRGEDADGAAEGVPSGKDAVLVVEAVGEPFAEPDGIDRPAVVAAGAVGDDGPGMAEGGSERGGVFDGVIEQLLGAGFGHAVLCGESSGAVFGLGACGWVSG